ncbi:MAG: hypothetical protein N2645_21220 [Clostridia bacterium]|nr:hypothetical protein [Clostridia bacterium]
MVEGIVEIWAAVVEVLFEVSIWKRSIRKALLILLLAVCMLLMVVAIGLGIYFLVY